jgi:hypothetical protein
MLPPAPALTSALLLVSSGSAAAISLPPRTPNAAASGSWSAEHLAKHDWNRWQSERIEARYGRRRVAKRDAGTK